MVDGMLAARSSAIDSPRLPTIADIAPEICRCLIEDPPDRHEALRWVAQFLADFERAPEAQRLGMVIDEPVTTGDQRWDAMLAATAEHLCFHHGLSVPRWSRSPGRFLDEWWFVSPYRSLHASAFVATPAAFANRGVFLHASSLKSV